MVIFTIDFGVPRAAEVSLPDRTSHRMLPLPA
jgi:hypothetical protein